MAAFERIFASLANAVARWTGRPIAFFIGVLLVLGWAIAGPMFHYSDTWQLVINTSTTIITFLMVLLIQNTQNRDNAAIQAKLDELIRASNSRNHFIGIEHQSDKIIGKVREEVEQHAEDAGEHVIATGIAADRAAEPAEPAKRTRAKSNDAKYEVKRTKPSGKKA